MKTILLLSLLAAAPGAPAPANVQVSGDLPKSGALGVAELEKLGTVDLDGPDPSAKVTGVPLLKVLRSFGYEDGPKGPQVPKEEKHSGYRKVVVVTATDGYQAVFSCAEIDDAFGPSQVLLVFKQGGKVLANDVGPFRLVVPTDKGASRAIFNVARMEVVDLRRVTKAAPRP